MYHARATLLVNPIFLFHLWLGVISMKSLQKKPVLRRTLDNIIRYTSSIGEDSEFTGSFSGGNNIVVRGRVKGESNVNGVVVIAETGCWDGKLIADVAIVLGTFNGDIEVREKIEVHSTAKVTGNISSPVIAIETGAVHEGHIDMTATTVVNHFDEKRHEAVEIPE